MSPNVSSKKKKKSSTALDVVSEGAELAADVGFHLGAEAVGRLALGSVARAPQAVGLVAGEFATGAAVRSAAFVTGGTLEGGTQASLAALEVTPEAMEASSEVLGACVEGASGLVEVCMETAGEVVAGLFDFL